MELVLLTKNYSFDMFIKSLLVCWDPSKGLPPIYPIMEPFFLGELILVIKLRAGFAECQKLRSFFNGDVLCDDEMSPRLLCYIFIPVVLNVVL